MPYYNHKTEGQLHDDGTKIEDNFFLRLRDKANGDAQKRLDETKQHERDTHRKRCSHGPFDGPFAVFKPKWW